VWKLIGFDVDVDVYWLIYVVAVHSLLYSTISHNIVFEPFTTKM